MLSDMANIRLQSLPVDWYFDNSVILFQFEHLFKLLEFKEEYRHCTIEILVDNAKTHTALFRILDK